MKKSLGCLVVGLTLFLNVQPVVAQSNVEYQLLQKEIQSIKEGQEGLKRDIQELKKLIQSRPAGGGAGAEFKEAIIDSIPLCPALLPPVLILILPTGRSISSWITQRSEGEIL